MLSSINLSLRKIIDWQDLSPKSNMVNGLWINKWPRRWDEEPSQDRQCFWGPVLQAWMVIFLFFFLSADWILRSEKWKHARESFCACIWRFPIVSFTHYNLVVLITGPHREEMRQILLKSDFKTRLCGGHGFAQRKATVILILRRVTQIFRQLYHFVFLHRLHLTCVWHVKKVCKLAVFHGNGLPWAHSSCSEHCSRDWYSISTNQVPSYHFSLCVLDCLSVSLHCLAFVFPGFCALGATSATCGSLHIWNREPHWALI